MAIYTSKKGVINAPAASIYMSFVDPRIIVKQVQENMAAKDAPATGRIIEVTYDYIRFEVKGIEMQIDVLERRPYSLLAYGSDKPLKFRVELCFNDVENTHSTEFYIKADVEMNIFIQGIVGGKIQSGLDAIVDGLSKGQMPDFSNIL